jgi:DMSO/TMAO reductase YedYZ heme-binding membrane subunit
VTAVAARARPRTAAIGLALCALAAAGAGAIIAASLAAHPGHAEGWLHAARYTARLSFLLFLPVFVARPWHQLRPSGASRWALRHRRALGLTFATAHFLHLYALTRSQVANAAMPDAATLVGGGAAYLLLAAMVATSNDASVRALGVRRWKRLHTTGLWVLWFVFFQSYAGRVAAGKTGSAGLLGAAVAALGLRIATRVRRRGRPAGAARPDDAP